MEVCYIICRDAAIVSLSNTLKTLTEDGQKGGEDAECGYPAGYGLQLFLEGPSFGGVHHISTSDLLM